VLETALPEEQFGFRRVWTDSRSVEPGDLFVALPGERFDGHDYLKQAKQAGALGAVVSRAVETVEGLTLFRVADTTRALGRLATARRRDVPGPVVAITGSSGKTSTKEMVAAVLSTRYRVHKTSGNLNNLIGIPLTILSAPPGTEALVLEAGASLPGEVARYREMIEPDIALVTNVGPAHLEGFGSLAAVMREKLTLLPGATLAVVGDGEGLAAAAEQVNARLVTAGLHSADVMPQRLGQDEAGRAVVEIDGVTFKLPLPGAHLAGNSMLAWAVVRYLELDPAGAAVALESLPIPAGRGQVRELGGIDLLDDCYNANPDSFRAAIETARTLGRSRRVVWVVGTMRELGAESREWHGKIAAELWASGPALIGAVGEF